MDLQSEHNDKQAELMIMMAQNQQLYKKRAQDLFSKIQAITRNVPSIDFLQDIHFNETIKYINEQNIRIRNLATNTADEELALDEQIRGEIQKQNKILLQQIQLLNNQINQLDNTKTKYQLALKQTANKVLELEQIVLNHKLKLDITIKSITGHQRNPSFYYSYDQLPNGVIKFKPSYVTIINHYFKRIKDNQAIISKLQNGWKQTVRDSEQMTIKIKQFRIKQTEWQNTVNNIGQLKHQIAATKRQLIKRIEEREGEVQAKLPQFIDTHVKEQARLKTSYERAYYSILQIVKKVIDNPDINKLNDYVQNS